AKTRGIESDEGMTGVSFVLNRSVSYCGIYVAGIGYYFYTDDFATTGEYCVFLKNVPVGSFSACAFYVDDTGLYRNGDEYVSFNRYGRIIDGGQEIDGLRILCGKFVAEDGRMLSAAPPCIAYETGTIFGEGEVSCNILGAGGGIIFSLTGDLVSGNTSRLGYYYVEFTGTSLILYLSDGESFTQLAAGETGEGVSGDEYFNLKVRTEEKKIECFADDEPVLSYSADKAIGVGNVGIRANGLNVSFKDFTVPKTSPEAYKEYALSKIDNLKTVSLYRIDLRGVETSLIVRETTDYTSEDGDIAAAFENAVLQVSAQTDTESAISVFNRVYAELTELILERYRSQAYRSVYDMVGTWYSTLKTDERVLDYTADKIRISGMEFISDFYNEIDDYTYDFRWWIPEPYRIPKMLRDFGEKVNAASSKETVDSLYEEFYFDVLRAVMQKNYEIYYAILKNADPSFDADSSIMWRLLWAYYGDGTSGGFSFTYDGPLEKYAGTYYNNNFRLCPMFYKPEEMYFTVESMVSAYNWGMSILKTGITPW
ncbi:MAG: hypothetical protein ACI4S9_04925, partial [Christensenellales bacterium]